ncbi:hypothetical protein [Fontivita pretiosa]|uniref:hypothetical protein n=1 Tax=Fontivita pretiosa TaxID=2989684 RepID=UPI003D1707FB
MSGQSEAEMMRDALERARRLLRELEKQRDEVEANPPDIPPEQLAVGRMAMNNAIASARRMLQALTEAEQIRQELPEDRLCDDQEQTDQQTEADSGIQDESE